MTASEFDPVESLKASTEKVATSLAMIGLRVLSDQRIAGPIERVQREIRQAKAVGQLTVLTLGAKLKTATEPSTTSDVAPMSDAPRPASAEAREPLGIPNYVELSASQIVPLLDGLTIAERAAVLAYETATRQRRTILAALGKFPA